MKVEEGANNRAHKIGIFDPSGNTFTDMDTVSPGSEPYAIVVDREDYVWWYSEFTTDQIVRYDPRTNQSIVFKTPATKAQVRFLTVAPDGSIWYTNFGNSRIGRIGR